MAMLCLVVGVFAVRIVVEVASFPTFSTSVHDGHLLVGAQARLAVSQNAACKFLAMAVDVIVAVKAARWTVVVAVETAWWTVVVAVKTSRWTVVTVKTSRWTVVVTVKAAHGAAVLAGTEFLVADVLATAAHFVVATLDRKSVV